MSKPDFDVILGNSNPKFSGVTSTMLQTMALQQKWIPLRVLGQHHLTDSSLAISFSEAKKLCRSPTSAGLPRVFHARRNDEMLQALALKHLFGAKLKICFTSTAQRKHSGFTKLLMNKMDGIISTCPEAAAYLDNPPDVIISHGVNTEVWQPSTASSAQALSSLGLKGQKAVGIFGRVRAQKGVDLFVEACIQTLPKHSEYCAYVVGGIDEKNQAFARELKNQVQKAGLEDRIFILGEQAFDKLPLLMRSMDIVCALSDNEGFGLTVLEAMASGCAVIASRAGAWPSILKSAKSGILLEDRNVSSVENALDTLMSNPNEIQTMGDTARQHIVEHYALENEAKQLVDYYKTLQRS